MAVVIYKTTTAAPDALGTNSYLLICDSVEQTIQQTYYGLGFPDFEAKTAGFVVVAFGALPAYAKLLVVQYCYNPNDLVISQKP